MFVDCLTLMGIPLMLAIRAIKEDLVGIQLVDDGGGATTSHVMLMFKSGMTINSATQPTHAAGQGLYAKIAKDLNQYK